MFEACRTPPLLKPHETEIVESGCTGHFILVTAQCSNKVKSQTPLTVRLPNGATMESSHTAQLNIPHLNAAASLAHVFPGMANDKLLPLPQPPVRACTDARTNPSAQRATQLRRVLVRVYTVSIQNQITTTVP
jgi:hypothetical protein